MADNALKIEYKLYLEAEDVSQSRILSSASYLENVLHKDRKSVGRERVC